MQFITNIFWNGTERRVRALWRLILQLILLFILLMILQGGIGFIAFNLLMQREGIALEQLSDPQVLQESMSPQNIQEFLFTNPVLVIGSAIAMIIAFTLSAWLAGRFLDRRRFADFGFHLDKNWWLDFGFGLGLGAVLMFAIFIIELALGWVTISDTFATRNPDAVFIIAISLPLINFLTVGFYEELFSRGYQLQNMAEGLNWKIIGPRAAIILATLLSSAIFGALHAVNPNASLISTINLMVAGIFLAAGYLLTGELAIPIGLHITWNFFQGNVFGFPVSGGNYSYATFISIEQGGPAAWTGGAFGPEAGLLGLGTTLLGIGLVALWVRWRYGQVSLHTALAETPERVAREQDDALQMANLETDETRARN